MADITLPPLDLEGLRVLHQVGAEGSVQAAAKRLGMSRATVRRRLEQLETAVGVPLLHRDFQGARLTRAGEVLAARGAQLMADLQEALLDARHAASEATGLVRIVMPVGLQLALVTLVLGNVKTAGLKIRIALEVRPDPAGGDLDRADLMFHFGSPPDDDRWFSRVVRRAPMRLVASPQYLELRGAPARVEDLADHDLLVWQGPNHPTDHLPLQGGRSLRISPWLVSPNIALLRRMAAEGLGIAFAPDGGIPDEVGVGPLEIVLGGTVGRDEGLRASSPLPSRVDPRAAEFAERVYRLLSSFPEV